MLLCEALSINTEGIITCVGAGGKSSLLMSLAAEFRQQKRAFLLTTTTKMFFRQVQGYFPVFTRDYERGRRMVGKFILKYGCAGLFKAWRETKVDGIPPEWINDIYSSGLVKNILVEGDGARKKLLKAPGINEPVIPELTGLVVGVLSLRAVGRQFSSGVVHRAEIAAGILGKENGDIIEHEDLGYLAGDSRGIFCKARGRKVLVLSGGNGRDTAAQRVVAAIKKRGQIEIDRCIVTQGFGEKMKVVEVYPLDR